jgi:hypothetical protein
MIANDAAAVRGFSFIHLFGPPKVPRSALYEPTLDITVMAAPLSEPHAAAAAAAPKPTLPNDSVLMGDFLLL